MTIMFNPREAVQKLRDRNFDEPQANAIVEVAEDVAQAADTALDEATSALATKSDLREAVSDLRADFYRAIFLLAGFIITVAGLALAAARWLF